MYAEEEVKDMGPQHVELEQDFPPGGLPRELRGHDYGPTSASPAQSSTPLPPIPWRIFALSLFLGLSGIILIILGCVPEIRKTDPGNGLAFWLTGALVCIPGVFYSIKLFMAWRTHDPEERRRFLDVVPR